MTPEVSHFVTFLLPTMKPSPCDLWRSLIGSQQTRCRLPSCRAVMDPCTFLHFKTGLLAAVRVLNKLDANVLSALVQL